MAENIVILLFTSASDYLGWDWAVASRFSLVFRNALWGMLWPCLIIGGICPTHYIE